MPEQPASPAHRPGRPDLTRRGFLTGTGALLGLGLAPRLRVIADRSCVEVYADRGRAVLTELVFPGAEDERLRLFADGGGVRVPSLEVFDLVAR